MRRALLAFTHHALAHDSCVQIRTNQPDDTGVLDAFLEPADEHIVVDAIKEFLQIDINHHAVASLHMLLCCQHRVARPTAGPKTMTVFTKSGIDQRLQYLQQRLLDQTVSHGGIPNSRSLPSDLGMPTRRTGLGRYVPAISCSLMAGHAFVKC